MYWLASPIKLGGNLPFALNNGRFTIGRSRDCEIVIHDVSISRKHAQVTVAKERFYVEDMGSTNGLFLNDQLVKSGYFGSSDELVLGSVRTYVIEADTPEAATSWFEDSETYRQDGHVALELDSIGNVLTPTQRQIVLFLFQGKGEAEIAQTMSRSRVTVHNHIQEIYRRLNVHSLADLLRMVYGGTIHTMKNQDLDSNCAVRSRNRHATDSR